MKAMKLYPLKQLRAVLLTALCISSTAAYSADFFDTSIPEKAFTLGARIGVNTSNRTITKNVFDRWNQNSWGTGFDLGVIADIHVRDYLAIQPGIFFQSRSGTHTYVNTVFTGAENLRTEMVQYGHDRSYAFNVPILCSVRFNISDDVRWSVDLGPYFSFIMKNDVDQASLPIDPQTLSVQEVKARNFDVGVKMGCGLNICEHYYFGIHYLAGGMHPWKLADLGGKNKAWSFTIGYDF